MERRNSLSRRCCCLGIMTGTSLDGIDLAVLFISRKDTSTHCLHTEDNVELEKEDDILLDMGPYEVFEMPRDTKQLLEESITLANEIMVDTGRRRSLLSEGSLPPIPPILDVKAFREAERSLTDAVAAVVKQFVSTHSLSIDLVGFHGQTILHEPKQRLSWQLGDGDRLSKLLGMTVVGCFRQNDIQHGGQGAPLAPLYHQALFHQSC